MNNDIKSFLINISAGLLTAIVFLYLDKNGLTSLSYIVFGCYLLFIGLVTYKLVFAKKEIKSNAEKESNDEKQTNKVNYFKAQLNKHNVLDDTAVNILHRLWKFPDGLTDKAISKMLELDIQTVKYHLENLEHQGKAHGTLAAGQPRMWRLIQGGREYLIENKLIS